MATATSSDIQLAAQSAPHQYYTNANQSNQQNNNNDATRIDINDLSMTVQSALPVRHGLPTPNQYMPTTKPSYLQAQLKTSLAITTFEFNDPAALTEFFIQVAIKKSHGSIFKRFFSGVLAGCFVVFGCVFALISSGGLDPVFRAAYPAIPKLIIGATFPVCLLMILAFGADLFTGNCMYAAMALATGRIGFGSVANLLITSFLSNLSSILFFSYLLIYQTDLLAAEPYNSWMVAIAANKVKLSWGVAVLRGIGANAMVCTAVFMAFSARDALGRFVLGYFPIGLFAVVGFEHCIANMAFIPSALYYGAPFTAEDYIVKSLIPSTIGNIIGGSFVIGVFLVYLYAKPQQSSFLAWLHYVCVPNVSISEWFNELYDQILNDRPIKDQGKSIK